MVTRRTIGLLAAALAVAAALAYLRDPPWLISQANGLHRWEQSPGMPRYRWSGGHASFFVPATAGTFEIPVSTTFDEHHDQPMMVTIAVDGDTAARVVLTTAAWTRVRITLPPPGARKVRRIDIRTNVTRTDNLGVRVGEIELVQKAAAGRILTDDASPASFDARGRDRRSRWTRRAAARRTPRARAARG